MSPSCSPTPDAMHILRPRDCFLGCPWVGLHQPMSIPDPSARSRGSAFHMPPFCMGRQPLWAMQSRWCSRTTMGERNPGKHAGHVSAWLGTARHTHVRAGVRTDAPGGSCRSTHRSINTHVRW